jgi:hypothetical protein
MKKKKKEVDNHLTSWKFYKLCKLWPYPVILLPFSLLFFKIDGTLKIIMASSVFETAMDLKEFFKWNQS